MLYTKDGNLFAGNASVVSDELRQRLLDNKPALIEFLTPKPEPVVEPVGTIVPKVEAVVEPVVEVPKDDESESDPVMDAFFKRVISDMLSRATQKKHGSKADPVVEPVVEVIEPVTENAEPKPLVPIVISKIGDQEVNSVSARDLYLDLGLNKAHWVRWSEQNIIENDFFKDGRDYMGFTIMVNGNETRDFAVSMIMAQHIAMMAKTQRAHDYRNYFIECEKAAKGSALKFDHLSPEVIAALKQARTVQLAMGMTKTQSSKYARDLILDRFGVDMEFSTTGKLNMQLQLRIVK